MAEQMRRELELLIEATNNMDNANDTERALYRDSFAAFKARAEYYMNHRTSALSIRLFSQLAGQANYWYDLL